MGVPRKCRDVARYVSTFAGRSPSGLGYSPRCRSAPMAFGRGRPAIRSGSPSGPPNARQQNSIQSTSFFSRQSVSKTCIRKRVNASTRKLLNLSTPQLLFSGAPTQVSGSATAPSRGSPRRGECRGPRRPKAEEAEAGGDTSPPTCINITLILPLTPFLLQLKIKKNLAISAG
jgi:hypothetical protein